MAELVHLALDHGVGLVQMPCPEQCAWGGVLKTRMLAGYGRESGWARSSRLRRTAAAAFSRWTQVAMVPLAERVASQVADYRRADMEVIGIVGVGASPSCGVTCTMDVTGAFDAVATCPLHELTSATMNERVVAANIRPGPGLFTKALRSALRRRHVSIAFFEHDLLAELEGSHSLPAGLIHAIAAQPPEVVGDGEPMSAQPATWHPWVLSIRDRATQLLSWGSRDG